MWALYLSEQLVAECGDFYRMLEVREPVQHMLELNAKKVRNMFYWRRIGHTPAHSTGDLFLNSAQCHCSQEWDAARATSVLSGVEDEQRPC